MRSGPPNIAAMARAIGFGVVAVAIAAIALRFHRDVEPAHAPLPVPTMPSGALARELARCQAIGMAATDDAACKAAWAENRRRFFAPAWTSSASSTPTADQPRGANPGDR